MGEENERERRQFSYDIALFLLFSFPNGKLFFLGVQPSSTTRPRTVGDWPPADDSKAPHAYYLNTVGYKTAAQEAFLGPTLYILPRDFMGQLHALLYNRDCAGILSISGHFSCGQLI